MRTKLLNGVGVFAATGILLALSVWVVAAQNPPEPLRPESREAFERRLNDARAAAGLVVPGRPQPANVPADSPKIDLSFDGGTPDELIRAIEKASGQPLNAIVSPEDRGYGLPAFKVREVSLEDLFKALETVSSKPEAIVTGTYFSNFAGKGGGGRSQYSIAETSAGFRKQGNLWVFRVNKPARPPEETEAKAARFYQLEPYLAKNTIEDITTAVQTAWNMMGRGSPPATANNLKFHKETKLLIAVAEESQLQVIDDVLKALLPNVNPRVISAPTSNTTTNAPRKTAGE